MYEERRKVYHVLRSLSYLRTVFGFNADEFSARDTRNEWYVERHLEILTSVLAGKDLSELGIPTLNAYGD